MIAVTNGLDARPRGAPGVDREPLPGERQPRDRGLRASDRRPGGGEPPAPNRRERARREPNRGARRRLPHRDGSVGPPDCPLRRGERDREVHRPPQRVRHVPQHRACLRLADAIPPRIPRRPLVFVGGDNVVAVCPDLPEGRSPTRSRTWPTTSTSNCRSASVAVPPPTRQDSRPNTRSKRAETTERASNCQSLRHSATERRVCGSRRLFDAPEGLSLQIIWL